MAVIPAPDPAWCTDHHVDPDGSVRHGTEPIVLDGTGTAGSAPDIYVVMSRWDDPDGSIVEEPAVSIIIGNQSIDIVAPTALQLGQALIRFAGQVAGVRVEDLRLGDQVPTPDGLQPVVCLMHDGRRGEVAAYGENEEQELLRLPLGSLVEVVRTR